MSETWKKRIIRNWAALFGGASVGSLIGLSATAISARGLDLFQMGIFTVVQTFWRTVEGFLSFQSFNTVISFGAKFIENERIKNEFKPSFINLVLICLLADILMALAGAIFGTVLLWWLAPAMNISNADFPLFSLGATLLATMITGAPTGVLRIFGKFHLVAIKDVITNAIRLLLFVITYINNGGLAQYFLAWVASEISGNIFIASCAVRQLSKAGYTLQDIKSANILQNRAYFKEIINSLLSINIATMIRITTEEGDALLVGSLYSPQAAALYKMAKNFASIPYKLTGPLAQAIYPELAIARSELNKEKFNQISSKTGLLGLLIAITSVAFWIALGGKLISTIAGDAYLEAHTDLIMLGIAYGIGFIGLHINPSLLALGLMRHYLTISLIVSTSYFIACWVFHEINTPHTVAAAQILCFSLGLILGMVSVSKEKTKVFDKEDHAIS